MTNRVSRDVYVPERFMSGAKAGNLVFVKIDFWGIKRRSPRENNQNTGARRGHEN